MTDFLATLALRGAGLAPADGRGALAPRPRALFEPDQSARPADATIIERVDDVAHARAGAAVATPAEPFPAPAHATLASDVAPAPPAPMRPVAPVPEPAARAGDATMARPAAARDEPRPPAAPPPPARGPSSESATRVSTRATRPLGAATPEAHPVAADGRPATGTPGVPDAVVAAERLVPPPPPVRVGAVARPPEPRVESRPAVTVSIGRIDVEVGPPPRPPAPAQRSGPERTRGFEHYARARRGRQRS